MVDCHQNRLKTSPIGTKFHIKLSYPAVSSKIGSVKRVDASQSHKKLRLLNFGGKNRRFYAAATAMLALILAPFGLYAALNQGNQLLSGLFFAIIAGGMLAIFFAA